MADICDHNVGLAFEMHIDMALANDVPLVDIREVIFHAAPEAGYTNALQALVRFKEVVKEKQLQEFKDDEAATGGGIPNDPKLHERLESLAHGFGETWAVAVEQQWQRCHLSIKERALLSIAADVSNQTLGEPFAYHVRLALGHAATIEQIRDTIRFVAEFSFTKAWEALAHLNQQTVAHLSLGS